MASINRNLSLRALRVFCVAAERESFREAAEFAFLTSSAVSHQIKQLESDLGVELFERKPRSLSLSVAGRVFYEDVKPLLADLDAAVSKHTHSRAAAPLRISAQPFFASELLVPQLAAFVEEYPDIDIRVDTSDEAVEKHPGSVDISVRVFSAPPASLTSVRLFPLRLTPAGSPDFYDSIRVKSGKIVSEFPLVLHESRPRAWHEWQRSSRLKLPDPGNSVRLASMIAVARAAERGLGAALIPRQLAESWFTSGSLVQLFEHELQAKESYYLVHREEDKANKELQAFKSWVLQNFAEHT